MAALRLHQQYALQRGYSLVSILVACAISAILWQAGLQAYQGQQTTAKRQLAKQALIHNALFLERHYAQYQSFKAPGNLWPPLPHPLTDDFTLRHSSQPSSVSRADVYYLIAEARPHHNDKAILRIDQSQQVLLCEQTANSQRCRVY